MIGGVAPRELPTGAIRQVSGALSAALRAACRLKPAFQAGGATFTG